MWPRNLPEPRRGSPQTGRVDWEAALREHDRWLRSVVYSRVREPQAVDDVMQEVALAAVRESAPPADPLKVAPWLYRVAVRQALLHRRKCGRQRKLTDRYAERHPPAEADRKTPDPRAWLLAAERQQLVREALARLAPRDAELLLLKYTQDWSYQQIAAHLGVTDGAVEARLHRARQRLREQLAHADKGEVS